MEAVSHTVTDIGSMIFSRTKISLLCLILLISLGALGIWHIRTSGAAGPMSMVSGTYTGDGNDNRAITGLGFQADLVIIKAKSNARQGQYRTSTMVGDATAPLGASGNLSSNYIQSIDTDGFTIGNDAAVNENGNTYYWVAFKDNGGGDFAVGSYTGNSSDDRDITGLAFQPDFVMVKPQANGSYAWFLNSDMTPDLSVTLGNNAKSADYVQSLGASSFQVGTLLNANAVTHHWFAFKKSSGYIAGGTYIGNLTDNRSITGLGFQPTFMIAKLYDASGTDSTASRFPDQAGDASFNNTNNGIEIANIIQAFESDGFQLGQSPFVNGDGLEYIWFAWAPYQIPDLEDFTWLGTTSADWNNGANWAGGSAPGSGDTALFVAAFSNPCNINTNANVAGIDIESGYNSTITQNTGQTLTIGSSGYSQAGGTFTGGNSTIDLNGTFTLSGGTLTATTGAMFFSGHWTHTGGGIFDNNGGTVRFDSSVGRNFNVDTSETFHNLVVQASNNSVEWNISPEDTVIVDGTFTWNSGRIDDGTIDVNGDLVIASNNIDGDQNDNTVLLSGSGPQTCTFNGGGRVDNLTINNSSATCTSAGTGTVRVGGNLNLTAGKFELEGHNLTVVGTTFAIGASGIFQLQGSETVNQVPDTNSGTVVYDGTSGPYTIKDWTYDDLTIGTGTGTTTATLAHTETVSDTLSVAADDTLTIQNGFELALSKGSGSSLVLNGTIDGDGKLVHFSNTALPDTGTLSCSVRIDVTASDHSQIATRSASGGYGDDLEIYSNKAAADSVSLVSGELVIGGDFILEQAGAGSLQLSNSLQQNDITVAGDFSIITGGVIFFSAGTWNHGGDINNSGLIIIDDVSLFRFNGAGDQVLTCNSCTFTGSNNFANVEIASGATVSLAAGDNFDANGNITLTSGTFDSNGNSVSVGGDWINDGGTYVPSGSTVTFDATDSDNIIEAGASAFYNLTLSGAASGNGTWTVESDDLEVANALTVDSGDTLVISLGLAAALTKTSGSALTLNGSITGDGTLVYHTSTSFPTTGTISATLRMNATDADQVLSARTYNGDVEIYSDSTSAGRTVTLGTASEQILSFDGDLLIMAEGSQNMLVSGASNNPDVNLAGSIDFVGAGSGSEGLITGGGEWSIAGNIDVSGGSFTAISGNTIILDGNSTQTIAGLPTFSNLTISNTSGSVTGCSTAFTPGIAFTSGITVTGTYTITTAGVNIQHKDGVAFIFNAINWNGDDGDPIVFRNDNLNSGAWLLNVSGDQQDVSYVNVARSDASAGDEIEALNGTNTDCGNNEDWVFVEPDTTPAVFDDIVADPDTNSVVITWTSNEPTTSLVRYGLTAGYGLQTTEDTELEMTHAVTIPSLLSATTYHFQVVGTDGGDNVTESGDDTFTTDSLPHTVITNAKVTVTSATTATVTWDTNHPADSKIRYGLSTDYGSEVYSGALVTDHSIALTGLTPETTYHYELLSTGNTTAIDADATFTMLAANDQEPEAPEEEDESEEEMETDEEPEDSVSSPDAEETPATGPSAPAAPVSSPSTATPSPSEEETGTPTTSETPAEEKSPVTPTTNASTVDEPEAVDGDTPSRSSAVPLLSSLAVVLVAFVGWFVFRSRIGK